MVDSVLKKMAKNNYKECICLLFFNIKTIPQEPDASYLNNTSRNCL